MGSKRGSITHVQDVERVAQELKHCKVKEKQRDLLEELGEVALMPPGRDAILAHGGIGVVAEQLACDDPGVRVAADEALRRLVLDERCRLQVVKKIVPLLKHHSSRTKQHALMHVANLAIELPLNRAWIISSGGLDAVLGFVTSDDATLREHAYGCLYWLAHDHEVPPKVAAYAGAGARVLKTLLAPCGPTARERAFALAILAYLPDSAPDVPAKGLFKCLASQLKPDAAEFTLDYPEAVLAPSEGIAAGLRA